MRRVWRAGVAALALLSGAACVPWTVRPIDDRDAARQSEAKFDAGAFAGQMWESKIVAAATTGGARLGDVLAALAADPAGAATRFGAHRAGAAAYFLVRGEARILSVDTSSRAGFATLDVEPYDGKPDARLAIGPVIRGTAARDATGLITFDQFVNQLDYADVSNRLNDRVAEQVIAPLRGGLTANGAIRLAGALSAASPLPEIVPFQLSVERKKP